MKNTFTADGGIRSLSARMKSKRQAVQESFAGKEQPVGFFGKIHLWLKIELVCLRRTKDEQEKSSPKILW